jgi:hypothetical protein
MGRVGSMHLKFRDRICNWRNRIVFPGYNVGQIIILGNQSLTSAARGWNRGPDILAGTCLRNSVPPFPNTVPQSISNLFLIALACYQSALVSRSKRQVQINTLEQSAGVTYHITSYCKDMKLY